MESLAASAMVVIIKIVHTTARISIVSIHCFISDWVDILSSEMVEVCVTDTGVVEESGMNPVVFPCVVGSADVNMDLDGVSVGIFDVKVSVFFSSTFLLVLSGILLRTLLIVEWIRPDVVASLTVFFVKTGKSSDLVGLCVENCS